MRERKIEKGGKVVVAMSGGVDSSVAALVLAQAGYDVIGVTMKLFCLSRGGNAGAQTGCCSLESVRVAQSVADRLGIPHIVLDMEQIFRKEVLENFFAEYAKGRTPNPCILCNSRVKFGHLLERGESLGARFLATGHYARIGTVEKDGRLARTLEKACDADKDQSYFLWEMNQHTLSRTLFPLGEFTKGQVREMARAHGLEAATRPESQDFCFLPQEGITDAAGDEQRLSEIGYEPSSTVPGPIVSTKGRRIGTHRGIACYTTGQRRGLGLSLGKPAYVVRIEPETNTIVVGFEEDLYRDRFTVAKVNWVAGTVPPQGLRLDVKVRSRSAPVRARVTPTGEGSALVELEEPEKAVTPGQSAVWYEDSLVVGGGIIE